MKKEKITRMELAYFYSYTTIAFYCNASIPTEKNLISFKTLAQGQDGRRNVAFEFCQTSYLTKGKFSFDLFPTLSASKSL